MIILFLLLVSIPVILVASHFISLAFYRRMKRNGTRYAMLTRVLVFVFSFVIIAIALLWIVNENIRFER